MWPKPKQVDRASYKTKVKEAILTFKNAKEFRLWLKTHHTQQEGIWLRFFKKDSGKQSFTYAEALDEALCYGWIDSLVQKYDSESYIQKFSPRKSKSVWSQRNIEHIQRLIQSKRMRSAGLAQYNAAKLDGRLDVAYVPPSKAELPRDLLESLKSHEGIYRKLKHLPRSVIHRIAFQLSTAKRPETRNKRLIRIIEELKEGVIHKR